MDSLYGAHNEGYVPGYAWDTEKPTVLNALQVKAAAPRDRAYKLADGNGLFLLIEPTGSKKWRYRFRLQGKEVLMGLGAYPQISLADARGAHMAARTLVAKGVNPLEERRRSTTAAKQAIHDHHHRQVGTLTTAWIDRRKSELRTSTLAQARRELQRHILPKFGARDIRSLTRPELTQFLLEVQRTAPETARNLRGHLHNICEHAIDTGALEINPTPPGRVLGRRSNVHHAALPTRELGSLLRKLDANTTIYERTRNALMLLMLTACRKQEVTAAKWEEIDLKKAIWRIPAERMKAKREHFVPLSRQALALLGGMRLLNQGMNSVYVFPHRDRPNKPMQGASLNALLNRMGYRGLATPHGMRATFSTHFNAMGANADVIERCLAHDSPRSVRSAYNRYQYEDERRALLQQWADRLDEMRATTHTTDAQTGEPEEPPRRKNRRQIVHTAA